MEVIKLLGTNGGSMYGAGGAHPFENPTGLANIFDLLLLLPLASAPPAGPAPTAGGHVRHERTRVPWPDF
jgi:potassium-transporting ATPase potassium-binding subunit